MNVHCISTANLCDKLPNGFQERCAFNIADSAADFCNYNIRVGFLANPIDAFLNFIGDMGDYLNRSAEIIATAFLV